MNNLDNFLVLLSMRSKVSDFDDLDPEFEKE